MERATVTIYEDQAQRWRERRTATMLPEAGELAARVRAGGLRVDAGCGPGNYLAALGRPAVALDAAHAMLVLAREAAPDVPGVQADLEALPFRRGALAGAWARNSYLHVPKARLPLALARLHDALRVDAPLALTLISGDREGELPSDDFPGRFFALWRVDEITSVLEGAGFLVHQVTEAKDRFTVEASRARTLPDFVAPDMQVLVCGLNPSLVAADAGFGYAGPSNRFWKAATASGLITRPRDPWRVLAADRVGMTDMVKRATPRASELSRDEYRAGATRLDRLVRWLQPEVVLFVGLEGWRVAVDRAAVAGPQQDGFAGAAAYVMPSTSGLNAHSSLDSLVEHMRAALQVAGRRGRRRRG